MSANTLYLGTYPGSIGPAQLWEFTQAIDTTSLGNTYDIFVPPNCTEISLTLKVNSTASCTLQICNCPQSVIDAGNGIWFASGSAVTGGAIAGTVFQVPPHSFRVNIGTALAGVNAYLSIVGRAI